MLAFLLLALAPAADDGPTYERDVRPMLARRCLVCHNAKKLDKPDVSAGLALDTFEATARGTADHAVLTPGKAAESELYRRLVAEDDLERMPYLEEPLPEADRELIRRWIDAGAPRGEPVADATEAAPVPPAPRRVVRTFDVVLPTEAKVPSGVEGLGDGGPVEVALKVGPMPAASAVAFRGDGALLAVGTAGRVVLWDLDGRRAASTIEGIPGPVHALAFSRDGRRLAVGAGMPARSGAVRVHSVPDGTLLHDFAGHSDAVYAVAFAPDDARLASAGFDQTIRIWDLVAGKAQGAFTGHSDFVYDLAFEPGGKTLLSASKDRSVKRIDVATLRAVRTYSGHDDDVLAVAARPDGKGFVSAGNEPQIRWWEADADEPAKRIGGHGGPVFELAFSADGKRLASASGDGSVRLWDGSGGVQKTLPGPGEWQYAVALSPDGRLVAAGGWDGVVRVWDADAGKLVLTLILPPPSSPGSPCWLSLSPDATLASADELAPLVRWRVGGKEVDAGAIESWKTNPMK